MDVPLDGKEAEHSNEKHMNKIKPAVYHAICHLSITVYFCCALCNALHSILQKKIHTNLEEMQGDSLAGAKVQNLNRFKFTSFIPVGRGHFKQCP